MRPNENYSSTMDVIGWRLTNDEWAVLGSESLRQQGGAQREKRFVPGQNTELSRYHKYRKVVATLNKHN